MNPYRGLFGLLLGRRLPVTSGTLRVEGISGEVLVRRDAYGIPHIEARDDGDAAFALGFCQGQDRAFQLELLRRIVHGTLAELVGADAVPIDRLARRIGFARRTQEQVHASGDDVRTQVERYAEGVNAGRTLGSPRRAHEFLLLRSRPTPWEAGDALGVGRLVAFLLASNWDVELARLKVLTEDGPEAVTALEPGFARDLPVIAPPGAAAGEVLDRVAADLELFAAVAGMGGGSNNWVLAGSRTATGRPILANDPHLSPTVPPHWYLAHVRTADREVAGATLVGTPAFLVAHNGHGAWGVTAGMVDNTDLFVEEMEGATVRVGNDFVPCERWEETIRVRGGSSVVEEVLVTPNGPVVGPALEGVGAALSMRATWLEPRPTAGFLAAHRATSFEEFRALFDRWPSVPLSVVWADASGRIAWQLVGDVPVRRKGSGTIPRPGWDADAAWQAEPVPFDEMPHLADPPEGFIATANNKPVRDDGGPFLGIDWLDGYRAARIDEELAVREDWDVEATQRLQLDVTSRPWREMRGAVLRAHAADEDGRLGLRLLAAWDGAASEDSAGATVFELLTSELIRRVTGARAPRSVEWALGKGFHVLAPETFFGRRRTSQLVRLIREQPEGWLERGWPDEVGDALGAVVRGLRERFGADPASWAWGRIRPLVLQHAVGSRRPLDRVFNLGPLPGRGDSNTVAQASVAVRDPLMPPTSIASLRAVIDVGEWSASRFSVPGGQSGNPVSPHYDDLLPHYVAGTGVPIAWSGDEVRGAARTTLRLVPAAG